MNIENMSRIQRQLRQNIRNFLLGASPEELRRELEISQERGNQFRVECIIELIEEQQEEEIQSCSDCGLPKCTKEVAEMYDEIFGEGTAAKVFPPNLSSED